MKNLATELARCDREIEEITNAIPEERSLTLMGLADWYSEKELLKETALHNPLE